MARLSAPQIAALAKEAGFTGANIAIAVAVALAESGGDTAIISKPNTNGTRDLGLWQINSGAHSDLLARYQWSDPKQNATMAYTIWRQAGNRWTPWTTFNTGSYAKFMGAGATGAANSGNAPPVNAQNVDVGGTLGWLGAIAKGLVNPLIGIPELAVKGVEPLTGAAIQAQKYSNILKFVLDPIRILMVLTGMALVILALIRLTGADTVIAKGAKTAAKVAATAAVAA
jgi:hypothetical protein